jgi:hypothetical protein
MWSMFVWRHITRIEKANEQKTSSSFSSSCCSYSVSEKSSLSIPSVDIVPKFNVFGGSLGLSNRLNPPKSNMGSFNVDSNKQ